MGLTTTKASMAAVAFSTTDSMEWVPLDVTDRALAVLERLGGRSAIDATVSVKVVFRWVMAKVAFRKD